MYPYTGGRAYGGTAGVAEASKADTNAPAAGPVRHTIRCVPAVILQEFYEGRGFLRKATKRTLVRARHSSTLVLGCAVRAQLGKQVQTLVHMLPAAGPVLRAI